SAAYCPIFFFFFQAEDGIRDRTVTGVQTCALPIYHPRRVFVRAGRRAAAGAVGLCRPPGAAAARPGPGGGGLLPGRRAAGRRARSEERRVGKEGRWRWAP